MYLGVSVSALSEKAQRLHAAVREASQDQPSFRKINKFTVTSHSIMQCCGVGLARAVLFWLEPESVGSRLGKKLRAIR